MRLEDYFIKENLETKAYEIVRETGENGVSQAKLWKTLGLSSREGSRLAKRLERKDKIRRKRILEDGRWTYKLIAKKPPRSISDLLEIPIPKDLATSQSFRRLPRGGLTKAYHWRKGQKCRISRFLLDRELVELNQILSELDLGKKGREVADEAHDIFKKAVVADISRGRSIEAMTAAVIYAACRRLSVPANLNEICKYSNAKKKSLSKCYRKMLAMNIFVVPLPDYSVHLKRLWNKLDSFVLTEEVWSEALRIFNKARSIGFLRGRHPASIAAASIYLACLACGRRLSQWEIANAAGISEVTLRNNYKKLQSVT